MIKLLTNNLFPYKLKQEEQASTRFYSTQTTKDKMALLEEFYTRIVSEGADIIAAVPGQKRPAERDGAKRQTFNDPEIILFNMRKSGLNPMIDWRHVMGTRSVVLDFDYHKFDNQKDRDLVESKLLTLAEKEDWTVVGTPRGGLHIYFQVPVSDELHSKRLIGFISRSFIPHIDYLGGASKIMGPNLTDRPILRLSTNLNVKIPSYLLPVSTIAHKNRRFLEALAKSPLTYWNEGFRATGMLLQMKENIIIDDEFRIYNKYFCNPPKNEDDLLKTVLTQRPKNVDDVEAFNNPYKVGVVYNIRNGKAYLLGDEDIYWKEVDLFLANRALAIKGHPYQGTKLDNFIRRNLAVEDLDASRRAWESSLPTTTEVVYYANQPLFVINEEGHFRIEPIARSVIKENFVCVPLRIDWSLSFEQGEALLNKSKNQDLLTIVKDNAPLLHDFLFSRTLYKSKELKAKVAQLLINFIALIFWKNSKNNNYDLRMQRIFYLTGPGGSGKSLVIDLAREFVGAPLNKESELNLLSEKFELSKLIDAVLVSFPDQEVGRFGKESDLMHKMLNGRMRALSGHDSISTEVKFGPHGTMKNYAMLAVTSNIVGSMNRAKSSFYGAGKRRICHASLNKQIPKDKQEKDYLQKLLKNGAALLPLILAGRPDLQNETHRFLDLWDLEKEIYDHKEYESYDDETCATYGFVKEILAPKPQNRQITVNLTFNEMLALYIQYITLRKGRRNTRRIVSFEKSMRSCFNQAEPIGKWIQVAFDEIFIPSTTRSPLSSSREEAMEKMLNSRGDYVSGFTSLDWSQEIRSYQTNDKVSGQFTVKEDVEVPVALNVKINVDLLEELEGIVLPVWLQKAIITAKSIEEIGILLKEDINTNSQDSSQIIKKKYNSGNRIGKRRGSYNKVKSMTKNIEEKSISLQNKTNKKPQEPFTTNRKKYNSENRIGKTRNTYKIKGVGPPTDPLDENIIMS